MDITPIDILLKKFEDQTLTNEESMQLRKLLEENPDSVEAGIFKRSLLHQHSDVELSNINWDDTLAAILNVDKPAVKPASRIKVWKLWTAAAAALVVGLFGFYQYSVNKTLQRNIFAADIEPGKNKAFLKLANGKIISLNDATNGQIANEAGISISKTKDGQLIYNVQQGDRQSDENRTNTISTPNGGQWQVRLPDGTMVWLNASSSLTYPLAFSGKKSRKVELNGEAYFEVAKNVSHPFVVKTNKQEITVLGTHFNVANYADETLSKTTLLEGSVEVRLNNAPESHTLQPGDQAEITANLIHIKKVDTDEAIAWKNGYFMFNNEKQENILRKIARWYDVEIVYADAKAKEITYYGTVSRFDNVSKVLHKFQETGEVRFEIDGKKVIVYKR